MQKHTLAIFHPSGEGAAMPAMGVAILSGVASLAAAVGLIVSLLTFGLELWMLYFFIPPLICGLTMTGFITHAFDNTASSDPRRKAWEGYLELPRATRKSLKVKWSDVSSMSSNEAHEFYDATVKLAANQRKFGQLERQPVHAEAIRRVRDNAEAIEESSKKYKELV